MTTTHRFGAPAALQLLAAVVDGVALSLVVAQPSTGWLLLGLAMAGACLGIARLAASAPHVRTPDPVEA